jgi:prepilin-type N-terminal cleavage/methylation domain-containing protein
MKRSASGFTLIELVVVIVVLAILAIVAIPNYIDLAKQARQGATEGVAGALSSWGVMHYAGCIAPRKGINPAEKQEPTPHGGNCADYAGKISGVNIVIYDPDTNDYSTIGTGNYGIVKARITKKVGETQACTVINGDDSSGDVNAIFQYMVTPDTCT